MWEERVTEYLLSSERGQHQSVTTRVWRVVSGSRWHSGCLRKVRPEVIGGGALYQALGEEGGARGRREKANDTQKAKRRAARTPVSSPLFLQHPGICLPLWTRLLHPPLTSPFICQQSCCVASTQGELWVWGSRRSRPPVLAGFLTSLSLTPLILACLEGISHHQAAVEQCVLILRLPKRSYPHSWTHSIDFVQKGSAVCLQPDIPVNSFEQYF